MQFISIMMIRKKNHKVPYIQIDQVKEVLLVQEREFNFIQLSNYLSIYIARTSHERDQWTRFIKSLIKENDPELEGFINGFGIHQHCLVYPALCGFAAKPCSNFSNSSIYPPFQKYQRSPSQISLVRNIHCHAFELHGPLQNF